MKTFTHILITVLLSIFSMFCKPVFAITCPFSNVHVSSDVSGEIFLLLESFFCLSLFGGTE